MKRMGLIVLCGVVFAITPVKPVHAVKAFSDVFNEKYAKTTDNDTFKAAVAEAKCNVCHYGKRRDRRNDFGQVLAKHITKDKVTMLKKQSPAAAKAAIEAALAKALAEKKEGDVTFADLIKSGKLPGTEPAE